VAALAGALRLLYGPALVGYDGMYSLVWGRDLAEGRLPDFTAPTAPTPHPLANLVAAPLSLLGEHALTVLTALSFVAFAAAALAAFDFGRSLLAAPVGALFAALLLTRDHLIFATLQSLVDIPFIALVLSAAALEARKLGRGTAVLTLLILAGLLRPEGWLLSGGYALWLAYRSEGGRARATVLVAGAAAPLIWCVFDLAVTGDPFYSLHGTQELAERLARPRGFGTSLTSTSAYLGYVVRQPWLIAGIFGLVVGARVFASQSILPLAILVCGLGSFVALGVAHLPLLTRYLLLPAVTLCYFAAVAGLGWLVYRDHGWGRRAWMAAAGALAIAGLIGAPRQVERIDNVTAAARTRIELQDRLQDLVAGAAAEPVLARCAQIYASSSLAVPLVIYATGRPAAVVRSVGTVLPRGGALITATNPTVDRRFILDPREARYRVIATPPGFGRVTGNAAFVLSERC